MCPHPQLGQEAIPKGLSGTWFVSVTMREEPLILLFFFSDFKNKPVSCIVENWENIRKSKEHRNHPHPTHSEQAGGKPVDAAGAGVSWLGPKWRGQTLLLVPGAVPSSVRPKQQMNRQSHCAWREHLGKFPLPGEKGRCQGQWSRKLARLSRPHGSSKCLVSSCLMDKGDSLLLCSPASSGGTGDPHMGRRWGPPAGIPGSFPRR